MGSKEDRILEQYKIMANSTSDVTEWRQKNNDFYLTINSALISIATLVLGIFNTAAVLGIALFGIALAFIWRENLQSYSKLNKAKFTVLKEMEKGFSFPMFTKEQEYYKLDRRKANIKIEKNVPILFILVYALIFVLAILKLSGHL